MINIIIGQNLSESRNPILQTTASADSLRISTNLIVKIRDFTSCGQLLEDDSSVFGRPGGVVNVFLVEEIGDCPAGIATQLDLT